MSNGSKEISLVLGSGSGGARGYAHIGVIRWIEEHELNVSSVVGSSMGALIGGCYATGKLDDYADWVCSIRKTDIMRLLDFTLSRSGFVDGTRIMSVLRKQVFPPVNFPQCCRKKPGPYHHLVRTGMTISQRF